MLEFDAICSYSSKAGQGLRDPLPLPICPTQAVIHSFGSSRLRCFWLGITITFCWIIQRKMQWRVIELGYASTCSAFCTNTVTCNLCTVDTQMLSCNIEQPNICVTNYHSLSLFIVSWLLFPHKPESCPHWKCATQKNIPNLNDFNADIKYMVYGNVYVVLVSMMWQK